MEDSQIQSIWLSGDDEPHPLKGEQYQGCYFYPEMLSRNQDQKDLNDDESTSESHGKILPLFQLPYFPSFRNFPLFTFSLESSSNDESMSLTNDKTPLLPKQLVTS